MTISKKNADYQLKLNSRVKSKTRFDGQTLFSALVISRFFANFVCHQPSRKMGHREIIPRSRKGLQKMAYTSDHIGRRSIKNKQFTCDTSLHSLPFGACSSLLLSSCSTLARNSVAVIPPMTVGIPLMIANPVIEIIIVMALLVM